MNYCSILFAILGGIVLNETWQLVYGQFATQVPYQIPPNQIDGNYSDGTFRYLVGSRKVNNFTQAEYFCFLHFLAFVASLHRKPFKVDLLKKLQSNPGQHRKNFTWYCDGVVFSRLIPDGFMPKLATVINIRKIQSCSLLLKMSKNFIKSTGIFQTCSNFGDLTFITLWGKLIAYYSSVV